MYLIRQAKIKEYMTTKQFASIRELRALCPEVTLMTLHRDLNALAREGEIIKLRGGVRIARQKAESSFSFRENENTEAKNIIAKKAITLIHEGGAVFFDAGTTTLATIRALPDINLTVITNGANFASELQNFSNISAYMCCGALNRANMALSGQSTLGFLESVNIDLGFVGVSGFTEESGFTCGRESEMHVKKLVIRKARKSVALMDATKLTRLMPYTFASLGDLDYVICDRPPPEDFMLAAKKSGVHIL